MAPEKWQPLVSWSYQHGEWNEMLRHQHAYCVAEHQKQLRRLKGAMIGAIAVGILLAISVGSLQDWLDGVVVGVLVAGLTNGILWWHRAGEEKWAKINSQKRLDAMQDDVAPVVEIAHAGIKIDEIFHYWRNDNQLRSVSRINQPQKLLRFDYLFYTDENYSKEFIWIPIPDGHEHEADRLVKLLQPAG